MLTATIPKTLRLQFISIESVFLMQKVVNTEIDTIF